MIDTRHFEQLLEGLDNEIADLPSSTTKNNLVDISSALYSVFEDLDYNEPEQLMEHNEIMCKLLAQLLSDEQKQRIKFKYNIDLNYGVTGNEWII